jgi:hypothetical protein
VVSARRKALEQPQVLPKPGRLRHFLARWMLQALAALILLGIILASLLWLGAYARDQVRLQQRFQTTFAEIDCNPPPGLERDEFLDQVQYYARLPERFSVLDNGWPELLKAGFAQHPWVARIDKVDVLPPHTVRVAVVYRQPVLAVVVAPDLAGPVSEVNKNLPLRVVDADGVLLPKKVPMPQGLPVLDSAPRPTGAEGKPWGDPAVEAAARAAVLLQSHWQRLELTRMTATPLGLVLWGKDVKVLWGLDQPGQAAPAVKLERMLKALDRQEGPREIDVR